MKKLVLIFYITALGWDSLAQENETRDFYFIISEVDSLNASEVQTTIKWGYHEDIAVGMDCHVWGKHYSSTPAHNSDFLAVGKVINVTNSTTTALLQKYDTSWDQNVFKGDMLRLKLSGKDGYQGIFTDLIRHSIYFHDQADDPFYYHSNIWSSDNPELEYEILNKMAEEVRNLGISLMGDMDDQDVVGGIYDGETMLGAMSKATPREVKSYLRYVIRYPATFMGKALKVVETFSSWVVNETSVENYDIAEVLYGLITEEDYETFNNRYGKLLDGDMALDLGIEILEFALTDYSEGMARMDKLIATSELSGDAKKTGWAYFFRARIFADYNKYTEATTAYLESRRQFKSISYDYGLAYTINNLGSAYESLEQWPNAITYYEEAVEVKTRIYLENATNENLEDLALGEKNLGSAYLKNGSYESATIMFDLASENYKTTGNRNEEIAMMEYEANIYAAQGDLERAVSIHEKRIKLAKKTNDEDQVADATFDIAYTYNGYGDDYIKAIPFYNESYRLHMALGDTTMATLSISNVAQSYWSLKELDKSIVNHEATIALAEAFGEKDRIADSWDKLADLYSENGNPKKSLEIYDRVVELYTELEDPLLAVTLNEIGDVYQKAKDHIKAISYYRRSVAMARENFDFVQSSDALYDIALVHLADNKYDLARQFYEESMRDAANTDYPTQEIYCLSNIGLIFGIKDEYVKSDSTYAIALSKAEILGDENIIAFNKFQLGGTATRQRDYEKAERLYNESFELYKKLDNKNYQVTLLTALSRISSNRGDFQKALRLLDEGLAIASAENDSYNMAYAYINKSDMYMRTFGEFDKAWEMQEKSMKLFEELDNTWGLADSYLGFGNIENMSGEYAEAIGYYQKSDSLYASLGNEYARAASTNNIGSILYWQADYEKSIEYFSKAIAILDKLDINDASRSMYVSNLGVAYLELKKYDVANRWLTKALADAQEINDVNQISTNLTYLGKLKTETEDFDEARNFLDEGLKLQEKLGMKVDKITTNFALGKLGYLEKKDDAEEYIQKSIDLSIEIDSEKELWEAYYYKGLIARQAGKFDDSKEHFIDAIETLEKIQGKIAGGAEAQKIFSSGEKQIKVYASLVDVLILKGETKLGMQYLERSNIESLRSKFKSLDISFKDEDSNEKLEKEKELKRKLDNLERSISDEKSGLSSEEKIKKLELSKGIAENEYLKFVNQTINTNPELARHFSGGFHPRKLKTDKNRRLIPDELVVLSYLPANDKLYIFAATSDTVIAKVVNVSTQELNKNIKFLYNFATHSLDGHKTDRLRVARGDDSTPFPEEYNTGTSRYKETSEKLFNWVIAPVREELDKKEEVVVIPTGMLHFLPFQMLGERLTNGKFDFLIEHYTLFYAHSLDMLYQQKDEITEVSILAMANADNSLPAAEQEVKELKKMYPNTDVFLHGDATEDKAKLHTGSHNILHFATHGNLDYFDYNKSYLTLAPNEDGTEDGKLTIEEVWEIEDIYEYQMVTLSACKTAVTDDFSTGWAVSPATSFIDAGAPTVVASLWAVNDASTGLLMKYFYGNLKTMTKVEALRRAQIQLSQNEEFGHPYYWAPFILIGDWR